VKASCWLLGFAGLGVFAGCASDPLADPGYHVVSMANTKSLPALDAYMAAAGCTVAAHGAPGVIGLVDTTGKPVQFDCHRVGGDIGRAAIHAYRVALRAARRGAALTQNDGYWALTYEYSDTFCAGQEYVGTTVDYNGIWEGRAAIIFTDHFRSSGSDVRRVKRIGNSWSGDYRTFDPGNVGR
jgi:hypothetical protein